MLHFDLVELLRVISSCCSLQGQELFYHQNLSHVIELLEGVWVLVVFQVFPDSHYCCCGQHATLQLQFPAGHSNHNLLSIQGTSKSVDYGKVPFSWK